MTTKKFFKLSAPVLVFFVPLALWILLDAALIVNIRRCFFPQQDILFYYVLPVSLYAFSMPLLAVFAWFKHPTTWTFLALPLAFWIICGVPGALAIWGSYGVFNGYGAQELQKIADLGTLEYRPWLFFIALSLYIWVVFINAIFKIRLILKGFQG